MRLFMAFCTALALVNPAAANNVLKVTTSPGTTTGKLYFYLQIDCYNPGVGNTGTKDGITATFYDTDGRHAGSTDRSSDSIQVSAIQALNFSAGSFVTFDAPNCNKIHDAVYFSNVGEKFSVGTIEVSTPGNDAFWMDEVRLFRVTDTDFCEDILLNGAKIGEECNNEVEAELMAHWGRDGGKGYCLSNTVRDFKSDLIDDRGCAHTFVFTALDGKVRGRR